MKIFGIQRQNKILKIYWKHCFWKTKEVTAFHLISFIEIIKMNWIKFMKIFHKISMMSIKNFVRSNRLRKNWWIKEQVSFQEKKNILKINALFSAMKKYQTLPKRSQKMLEMLSSKVKLTNIFKVTNPTLKKKQLKNSKRHG